MDAGVSLGLEMNTDFLGEVLIRQAEPGLVV